ncbi:phosphoserine phosphatase SerB [Puniceibacterium sp. IMCC21224]|uniref:phosphoserine phosphatase SerB n=1 Tax=Puniceibacterium sp. IMCC21224 TaxID=1618204 RepID=UPI00064DB668|nr:phosphoserine phosphatase SerB [Puniceibacterium sp. IMCC21224]KMK65614.1 phosphoserine phosphatase SerB [Puniceibacterium sp. IMCC21224]
MVILSLIARAGGLNPELAVSLRNALGGGDLQWLAPDEAAEFTLGTAPGHVAQIWQDLQTQGVDLNLLPAQNRAKRVLLADMDSTMIQQECIDELADAAGVGAQVKEITARAMNGELDFEGALTERVALLRGQPEALIAQVLESHITLMPGGATLLTTMKVQGAYAALVSGGFTAFTSRVAAQLGFDENRANMLESEAGFLTGTVARPILGRDAKVQALNEISARLGLTPADVLAVGDGANDLGMLDAAGLGVALHAKPSVQAQCQVRVNHGDLTALLFLQGFAKSDFAT